MNNIELKLGFPLLMLMVLTLLSGCRAISEQNELDKEGNWTMFRGTPSLSGYVDRTLPEHPSLLWEYRHGVRCVASPLVQDGVAYLCDKHGVMVGLDKGGTEVYRHDLQTEVEASWVMRDTLMYVGQIDGRVRALVRTTGEELWSYETEGQISASPTWLAPTAVGDGPVPARSSSAPAHSSASVVVGSYDGSLYVLDAETGGLKGRVETGYYVNGAAALCGEYAVFGGCDAWLRVVDCHTGIATDSVKLDAYIPASPAVIDNHLYVADYGGHVWEMQVDKGKIASQRLLLEPADDEGGMLSIPAVTRDAVYVLAESRYLCCLNRSDGSLKWKKMLKGEVGESSPLVCVDKVLACTKTGVVTIHDAETGNCLWEYETGEQIISSPAITLDGFYVLTARGTMLCFGERLSK